MPTVWDNAVSAMAVYPAGLSVSVVDTGVFTIGPWLSPLGRQRRAKRGAKFHRPKM